MRSWTVSVIGVAGLALTANAGLVASVGLSSSNVAGVGAGDTATIGVSVSGNGNGVFAFELALFTDGAPFSFVPGSLELDPSVFGPNESITENEVSFGGGSMIDFSGLPDNPAIVSSLDGEIATFQIRLDDDWDSQEFQIGVSGLVSTYELGDPVPLPLPVKYDTIFFGTLTVPSPATLAVFGAGAATLRRRR